MTPKDEDTEDEVDLALRIATTVFPCEPCMAAKVFPRHVGQDGHACTGSAGLPKGLGLPCPCCSAEAFS